MKVELNSEGLITIQAENETEAYALKQWCKENALDGNVCIKSYVELTPVK